VATKRPNDRTARERRQLLRDYEAKRALHSLQVRRRVRDNVVAAVAAVVVCGLAGAAQWAYFASGPGAPVPAPTATSTPDPTAAPDSSTTPDPSVTSGTNTGTVPDPAVAEGRTWPGTLALGDVELGIELDGASAPQAVAVVVEAIRSGYYVGKSCHRLIDTETAHLLQCGSIDGAGSSDPDFAFGPIENPGIDGVYPAGAIAMARRGGDAFSNGRQFFIVTEDTRLPDDAAGGYSSIGRVTSGLDALIERIMAAGTADGSQDGPPAVETTITGFTIE